MNRNRKKSPNNNEITNYDLSPFMPHNMIKSAYENETIETLKEKLQIKSEALNVLGKQLELCNKEKDEYKRLIDTLYDKNLSLKKTLYYKENQIDHLEHNDKFFNLSNQLNTNNRNSNLIESSSSSSLFNDIDSNDYVKVLKDLIKTLQKEKYDLAQKYDDIKQELIDSKSDLRLLREQIVRQRVGSYIEGLTTSINDLNLTSTNHSNNKLTTSLSMASFSTQSNPTNNLNNLKENLIKELEIVRNEKNLIENDLKLAICQKEEIEIERDTYKDKYLKLNKFLIDSSLDSNKNTDLNKLSLNIDELISQNKYLNETNQNLREEMSILKTNLKKFKQLNNSDTLTLTSSNNTNLTETNLLNKNKIKLLIKQADQYLEDNKHSKEIDQLNFFINEFKIIIDSLLEGLNDKLVAFQHQRKVNKMLANRIHDLENQINLLTKSQTIQTNYLNVNTSPFSSNSPSSFKLPDPIEPNRSVPSSNISSDFNNTSPLIKFENEKYEYNA